MKKRASVLSKSSIKHGLIKNQVSVQLTQNVKNGARSSTSFKNFKQDQETIISSSNSSERSSVESSEERRKGTSKSPLEKRTSIVQLVEKSEENSVTSGKVPSTSENEESTLKKGDRQHRPWFIWIISVIQLAVFLAELIKNWVMNHTPIEPNLSMNPLFGPSPYVLISMGSCFPPCMHSIDGITNNVNSTRFPCPNNSSVTVGCTLSQLCGFNGVSTEPNQWYRIFLSIFLHAGIVHIVLNLIAQILIGGDVERKIGTVRLIIIYFLSGIFGFIFGGNFASDGLSRLGCSGSLFAVIALSLLDLLYHWKETNHSKRKLIIILADLIISFVLGLLPGIDNFSHIGGFIMGLLLGLAILGSPVNLRRRNKSIDFLMNMNEWYNSRTFGKFFHNRPRNWWTWWFIRFLTLSIAIVIFVLLTENFYSRRIKCDWCQYISCLPVHGWCDVGKLKTQNNSF